MTCYQRIKKEYFEVFSMIISMAIVAGWVKFKGRLRAIYNRWKSGG
ncbi:hypothetical protein DJ66_0305 [Candidatus Liberibacter solanacearum]|uniref:Uncharacterized protein n=1 Tax=Candidatus Liberibacter solanacearum TaxID=556287 RepID=A0A0F4VJ98_9HYPH|nr:hypothetical protein DJ66_0305 [Candidatus Liberibacter solanacearum]